MTRNHQAEFQEFVNSWSLDGTTTSVVAAEIASKLRAEDPDLLSGWLDLNAEQFITRFLGDQARSRRSHAVSSRPRSAFARAAERFASGDREPLYSIFSDTTFVVDEEKTHKSVGSMTKADHLFVSNDYGQQAAPLLFEAAFHKAVAKRIPNGKTTADVMSEEDYVRLRSSIGSLGAKAA